ncbi:hypothetical protein V5799_007417 [Amblyomma americanum]|uniref:Lipocalin n=1 Tax=Amblyomma americanum TaxID=6943 RepID=A0AAQ4FHZ7_AMBAM
MVRGGRVTVSGETLSAWLDRGAFLRAEAFSGTEQRTYTLRYWNSTNKCFILSVADSSGAVNCEVYQWNQTIDQRCAPAYSHNPELRTCTYRPCEIEFYDLCKSTKPVIVYSVTKCKNQNPPLV